MKITLNRLNDAVHFEMQTEDGHTLHLDGSPEIGGEDKGPRPMQVVLMALVGCSSIDVVSILKKMRQKIGTFRVEVKGDRVDTVPKVFNHIELHFHIGGDVKESKAIQAIEMSLQKYCSVSKMLEKSVDISYKLTMLA